MKPIEVSLAEARRIAVRSQLLDGSATSVLDTVRRLGRLQIDPISTVAPPQYLVLWSRLGAYDRAELDRLLWEERKLIEWRAFIYPIEDLALLRGLMGHLNQNAREWLAAHRSFRRYVLRELERRGPLLSREIETHVSRRDKERHDWWGGRQMGLMLEILAARGEVAVAGRVGGQRIWDIADRVYPESERIPRREAQRLSEEKRFCSLGVKLEKGRWLAHPDAVDGPVPPRITFLSPFDRLIHDRDRAEALWDFFYRLEMYVPKTKRQYGYYVLPILRGDRIVGRIEPVLDRKAGELRVNGVWWENRAFSVEKPLHDLAKFLGAKLRSG